MYVYWYKSGLLGTGDTVCKKFPSIEKAYAYLENYVGTGRHGEYGELRRKWGEYYSNSPSFEVQYDETVRTLEEVKRQFEKKDHVWVVMATRLYPWDSTPKRTYMYLSRTWIED